MDNTKTIKILSFITLASLLLTGCFGGGDESSSSNSSKNGTKKIESGDTEWVYEKNIKTPIISKTQDGQELKLGDISKDKVEIILQSGALNSQTEVTLSNPDNVPKIMGEDFKTIGAPIEISIGKPTRLDEKATITFAFDKTKLPPGTKASEMRVVYYNGKSWSSLKPDKVDMELGTITYTSYHFSLFGANKISSEKKITQEWIHTQILDDELKNNLNSVSDHVTNQIIDLTLEKMGLNDKDLKTQILKDVLKDDGYKGIHEAYESGDPIDLAQKIALLAGDKITKIVPESKLQEALGNVVGAADDIKAASQAAGYIAEGRYKDAAKIIGGTITDKFIIGKAGKMAVEMVNYEIGAWKSGEIEAAYNAYKDGADGVFWGYNVDKGDFDSIWDQMRGIRRQIEIDAIKQQNEARDDAGMGRLTDAQADLVRAGIKESFRRQFAVREKREEEFKKQEETLKALVGKFKDADFFGTMKPKGLDKGLDYENELSVLYHFAKKMLKDTGRKEFADLSGLLSKDKLFLDDVVQGARHWFSGPEGAKDYAKFLKDRFNIIIAPDLSELAGSWPNGTLLIKDVIAPDAGPKSESKGEGCDIDFDIKEMIGKSVPLSLNIAPNGKNSGTISLILDGGDIDPMSFTYNAGVIKASMSKDGAVGTLQLSFSEDKLGYYANGSFILSFEGGKVKITTEIKSNKLVTAPVTPATSSGTKK